MSFQASTEIIKICPKRLLLFLELLQLGLKTAYFGF